VTGGGDQQRKEGSDDLPGLWFRSVEKCAPGAYGGLIHHSFLICRRRCHIGWFHGRGSRIVMWRSANTTCQVSYSTNPIPENRRLCRWRLHYRALGSSRKLVVVVDSPICSRRRRVLSFRSKGRRDTFGALQEHANVHAMRYFLCAQKGLTNRQIYPKRDPRPKNLPGNCGRQATSVKRMRSVSITNGF
jgi:hypothetical protein